MITAYAEPITTFGPLPGKVAQVVIGSASVTVMPDARSLGKGPRFLPQRPHSLASYSYFHIARPREEAEGIRFAVPRVIITTTKKIKKGEELLAPYDFRFSLD